MKFMKSLFPVFLALALIVLVVGCARKPPVVTKIDPASGPLGGGTAVTISGTGFKVGDTVNVITKILEGDKVRFHPFEGVVIAKKEKGLRSSFTVRKISYGEGVERVFPTYSPQIERIEILHQGKSKRAKLYYLRGRLGKAATKV